MSNKNKTTFTETPISKLTVSRELNKTFGFTIVVPESIETGKEQIVSALFLFDEIRSVARQSNIIKVNLKDKTFLVIPQNTNKDFEAWLARCSL